eukprot:sb/3474407/
MFVITEWREETRVAFLPACYATLSPYTSLLFKSLRTPLNSFPQSTFYMPVPSILLEPPPRWDTSSSDRPTVGQVLGLLEALKAQYCINVAISETTKTVHSRMLALGNSRLLEQNVLNINHIHFEQKLIEISSSSICLL